MKPSQFFMQSVLRETAEAMVNHNHSYYHPRLAVYRDRLAVWDVYPVAKLLEQGNGDAGRFVVATVKEQATFLLLLGEAICEDA